MGLSRAAAVEHDADPAVDPAAAAVDPADDPTAAAVVDPADAADLSAAADPADAADPDGQGADPDGQGAGGPADAGEAAAVVPAGTRCAAAVSAADAEDLQVAARTGSPGCIMPSSSSSSSDASKATRGGGGLPTQCAGRGDRSARRAAGENRGVSVLGSELLDPHELNRCEEVGGPPQHGVSAVALGRRKKRVRLGGGGSGHRAQKRR